MLGLVERDHVWNLLEDLHQKDGASLIKHIATLSEHTSNFDGALQDLLTALHHISIEQLVPGGINADYGDEQKIQQFARSLLPEEVQLFYQIGLMGQRDLSLAPTPRLGFEMTLMRMLAFHIKAPLPIHETAAPMIVAAPVPITPITVEKKQTTASTPEIKSASISTTAPEWAELIPQLQLKGLTLSLANNCALKAMHDGKIELLLSKKHAALVNEKQTERIEEALTKHFGKPTTVNISIHEQTQHSPAAVLQRQMEEKHSKAHEQLANDANLQNILEAFDTNLDANQVKVK
jgi:DNA polymerase-3 subunit gamma/tau